MNIWTAVVDDSIFRLFLMNSRYIEACGAKNRTDSHKHNYVPSFGAEK